MYFDVRIQSAQKTQPNAVGGISSKKKKKKNIQQ